MSRVVFSDMPLGAPRVSRVGRVLRGAFFALFLLQFALVYARLWQPSLWFGVANWPEGLLLILTAATLLASLTAQLPTQNVLSVALVIAVLGGLAHTVGARTGVPFGPINYTEHLGPKLFEPLPWAVPILWLVVLLACRGTARVVLRPWRTTRNYGFWVLGLTVALVVLFELALEPFATQAHGYWKWQPTKLKLDWYTAPLVNFLGWALVSALILAFITPSLISKKPVKQAPQYQPLAIWLLLNALLATSAALHRCWAAFGEVATAAAVVLVLTAYGTSAPPASKRSGSA